MTDERHRDGRPWPDWLSPLRPEPDRRKRMRAHVLAGARPMLLRRRRARMWDVAATWGQALIPLAAAAVLMLGWMVASLDEVEDPLPESPTAATVGELGTPDGLPPMLTAGSEPSADRVLQAVVYEGRPAAYEGGN